MADAFAVALEHTKGATALRQADFDVLQEFGSTLGTSDRVHQTKHFVATFAELQRLEEEARDAQRRNERLWQYLGVLCGLLLLIILY